jgi:isoleucyl-tRNA synthetase
MLNGRPPYKALLTHGFTVDGEGKKMSKSLGNTLAPQKISDTLGADILRLWVASTDYTGELSISDEILKRVTESPIAASATRCASCWPTPRTSTTRRTPCRSPNCWKSTATRSPDMAALQADIAGTTSATNSIRCLALQNYCSEDLGGFYLDILKDRLYTRGVDSHARRSAQTALWHITQSLLRVMAPILSFTAEEAWAVFAGAGSLRRQRRDHLHPDLSGAAGSGRRRRAAGQVHALREVRADVTKQLEDAARLGRDRLVAAGRTVDQGRGDKYKLLASLDDDLKFVFITSQAKAVEVASEAEEAVAVTASTPEVRALLALPRRCRHARRASGPVRPLRQQPVRQRRTAQAFA